MPYSSILSSRYHLRAIDLLLLIQVGTVINFETCPPQCSDSSSRSKPERNRGCGGLVGARDDIVEAGVSAAADEEEEDEEDDEQEEDEDDSYAVSRSIDDDEVSTDRLRLSTWNQGRSSCDASLYGCWPTPGPS